MLRFTVPELAPRSRPVSLIRRLQAMAARWLNRAIALAYFKWREVYLDMLEAIRRRAMG